MTYTIELKMFSFNYTKTVNIITFYFKYQTTQITHLRIGEIWLVLFSARNHQHFLVNLPSWFIWRPWKQYISGGCWDCTITFLFIIIHVFSDRNGNTYIRFAWIWNLLTFLNSLRSVLALTVIWTPLLQISLFVVSE